MKAAHYVLALGFPALASTGSFAGNFPGNLITKETALCIARKAVAPYCSHVENCIVTAEKIQGNWVVTLQEAARRATGELIPADTGRYATVEIDAEGNATATVPRS